MKLFSLVLLGALTLDLIKCAWLANNLNYL